jgi:uncharacterized protein (TIGR02271 family)
MQSNELVGSNELVAVIPVIQETIRVEKREFESGKIVVHKTVTERDEAVEVLLRQQDLSVERVPIGRVVQEAPQTRQEGDTLIVPILEEVLVVEKRLVLKEELHIRKQSSERMEQQTVRLRSEQVEIKQTGRESANEAAAINEEISK